MKGVQEKDRAKTTPKGGGERLSHTPEYRSYNYTCLP